MAERAVENQSTASKALPKREDPLARISHHLTVEARHKPAISALRLLTVLNVGFKYARAIQETGRRAASALYRHISRALGLAAW